MHCPPILRLSGNFMVDVGRAGSVGPHLQSSFAFLELSDLPWDLKTPSPRFPSPHHSLYIGSEKNHHWTSIE